MDKKQKIIDTIKSLANELKDTKTKIEELPKGYIQYKTVSGHRYAFRQWREGNTVKSEYINANYVPLVERKIKMRKAYQQLVKEIEGEIRKISADAIAKEILSEDECLTLLG